MNTCKKLTKEYIGAKVLIDCINGNWDSWRYNYNLLTPTDISWIYTALHRFVGSQAHFDFDKIKEVIDQILDKEQVISVCELGCWEGHLASKLLELYDRFIITTYVGYDFDYCAIDNHVVESNRFYPIKLNKWWHDIASRGSIMLSCHTIEHFDEYQLKKILYRCKMNNHKYLVWELPFCQDRGLKDWYGTNNTHLLHLDRTVFQFMIEAFGFDFFYSEKTSEGYLYGMINRSYK